MSVIEGSLAVVYSILFLWLPLCIAVGVFANQRRNRSGLGWALSAFFLSPLLGFLFGLLGFAWALFAFLSTPLMSLFFAAIMKTRPPRAPRSGDPILDHVVAAFVAVTGAALLIYFATHT